MSGAVGGLQESAHPIPNFIYGTFGVKGMIRTRLSRTPKDEESYSQANKVGLSEKAQ